MQCLAAPTVVAKYKFGDEQNVRYTNPYVTMTVLASDLTVYTGSLGVQMTKIFARCG